MGVYMQEGCILEHICCCVSNLSTSVAWAFYKSQMNLTTLQQRSGILWDPGTHGILTAIYIDTSLLRDMQPTKSASCEIYAAYRVGQNSTYGEYTVFLAGKSPNIRS